jgi:hypothetical protein
MSHFLHSPNNTHSHSPAQQVVMSKVVPMKGSQPFKPPILQITKAMSCPAFANKPSFLTSLHPELRNQVYEVLFMRKKPVLICDRDAVLKAREVAAQVAAFGNRVTESDNEDLKNELKADDISSDQTNFFLACRQIYTKAIGVCHLLSSSAH